MPKNRLNHFCHFSSIGAHRILVLQGAPKGTKMSPQGAKVKATGLPDDSFSQPQDAKKGQPLG